MITNDLLLTAYRLMRTAFAMSETYENNRTLCRYVHSTSRGHEAIQLATAFHLLPCDYVSPYYRDESLLLGLGFSPFELMLQLLAKGTDIFTGGREYYAHANYRGAGKPTIIHQSSATGMQAIPATGVAQGLRYLEQHRPGSLIRGPGNELPIVLCSLGDASVTEGEVSEAFQFAVLKKLPIIFLVQDNGWGISATSDDCRAMDAYDFAGGFPGMQRLRVDGSNFEACFNKVGEAVQLVRQERSPCLVHATVPLLGHHTSGVRKEFYRSKDELEQQTQRDPLPILRHSLISKGLSSPQLDVIDQEVEQMVSEHFRRACLEPDPDPATVEHHVFAPSMIGNEAGNRNSDDPAKIMMVDAALYAIREIMEQFPEAILYGQDVGRRLGGVFRETATLAGQFGDHRVFNTPIQEAYIIGSAVGMCATGLKPIVEIQFGDYIFPGVNQLVTEMAKSCYLSCGKFPIQALIRVPVGAYGGGGPYHSASIESFLLAIKGIKVVYPSNAADMKGLMKAAFLDPNPVVILEHKGLYWSKVPGTEDAKTAEPARDYVLPLGKATIAIHSDEQKLADGVTCCVVTYGMGVYWAKGAAQRLNGAVEIIDLRTLFPLDEEFIYARVRAHGKCLVVSEEQQNNSFAEALASRISKHCFTYLDAPVEVCGSLNLPAVPMNTVLEAAMLPNINKVALRIGELLGY